MYTPAGPTSRITTGEFAKCVKTAFDTLTPEDQENINRALAPLLEIRGMGEISALELLFAIDRADDLARLNEALVKGG